MEDRRIPKRILIYNPKKETKHRMSTVKMEGSAHSSRGRNRPRMAQSIKMVMMTKDYMSQGNTTLRTTEKEKLMLEATDRTTTSESECVRHAGSLQETNPGTYHHQYSRILVPKFQL
jgi:hypothetical protein